MADGLIQDISVGIHGQAVDMNFVVEVGPSGAAGASDGTDLLPPFDPLTDLDEGFAEMAVDGLQAIPVGDMDESSVSVIRSRFHDNPVGRRNDGRMGLCRNIHPGVEFLLIRERRDTVPETGTDPPSCRPDRGGACQDGLLGLQDAEQFKLLGFLEGNLALNAAE